MLLCNMALLSKVNIVVVEDLVVFAHVVPEGGWSSWSKAPSGWPDQSIFTGHLGLCWKERLSTGRGMSWVFEVGRAVWGVPTWNDVSLGVLCRKNIGLGSG